MGCVTHGGVYVGARGRGLNGVPWTEPVACAMPQGERGSGGGHAAPACACSEVCVVERHGVDLVLLVRVWERYEVSGAWREGFEPVAWAPLCGRT